ncbi:hypothetical protein PWK10_07460 [Caloramator sp. Dgby_cultured_2]|uniref:hypothetical protein n=1 Tax=Caloramator sp. Dgby_cultured_2 TaxID=3029174 RepID=UPI00237E3DD7|nr:hypothetical protein [Caloramator sp. Dgby_cultured_2]WDU84165.1 hypothetical protein PWK10_07460 [Caloramator sp. Dgby_cultured_2]
MLAILTKFVIEELFIYLIGGLLGVIFVHNLHDRSNVMFGGVLIGFLNSLIILSLGLILGKEFTQVFINMSYTIAGGIFSSVLAIGIMPIFEQIFDVVTPIKLMELSNPNQPLLKKFCLRHRVHTIIVFWLEILQKQRQKRLGQIPFLQE